MNVFDNITATKHVVAESSLLKSTLTGHILSLKAIADTDNGAIVARGALDVASADTTGASGEQVFAAKAYAAGDKPYLVLTTPIGYNSDRKYYNDECYFYNKKDEIMRAYELNVDDIFTVSADAISGSPVVGKYVSVGSTGLYTAAASAPSTGIVLQILEQVSYTNSKAYRLLVVKTGA